jgi:hypothetical protein
MSRDQEFVYAFILTATSGAGLLLAGIGHGPVCAGSQFDFDLAVRMNA